MLKLLHVIIIWLLKMCLFPPIQGTETTIFPPIPTIFSSIFISNLSIRSQHYDGIVHLVVVKHVQLERVGRVNTGAFTQQVKLKCNWLRGFSEFRILGKRQHFVKKVSLHKSTKTIAYLHVR